MNVEEAKDRLSCYRPGIDDPADEQFAPALLAAEDDPALASWFHDQQEFDSALRRHFKSAAIPDSLLGHLKKTIGTAAFDDAGDHSQSERATSEGKPRKSAPGKIIFASVWTRIAAAAAALVIGFLVVHSIDSSADAVGTFRGAMAKQVTDGFQSDHKSRIW